MDFLQPKEQLHSVMGRMSYVTIKMRKTMVMPNKFLIIFFSLLIPLTLQSQTVKHITLTARDAYTGHIALSEDSKDLDLIVKFIFNEQENRLSVTLLSYRSLFVFQEDVRYGQAVKKRKLRPDRLPYVVPTDPSIRIKASRDFRQQLPRPRRKFIFKRWFGCDGLQPIPQEYQLVNDYIEQDFDILHGRNEIIVSLHHLLVMDSEQTKNGQARYQWTFFKNLDLEYHITLQRDPCLGAETALQQASRDTESIRTAYKNLRNSYPHETVNTEEQFNQFTELKQMLTKQFPRKAIESDCPDVQQQLETYNTYVDSIAAMQCQLVQQVKTATGIDPDLLLTRARMIDNMVSRWIGSTDPIERRDLNLMCHNIINEMNAQIEVCGFANEEQKKAGRVFFKARQYYQTTINANKQP